MNVSGVGVRIFSVLALSGLASACYVQSMRGPPAVCATLSCRQEKATADEHTLLQLVEAYRNVRGYYPASEGGFDALVLDGYLVFVPKDPWGHEYVYGHKNDVLVISSRGRDGKPGGEGEDEDVFVYSGPRGEERHGD